MRLAWGQSCLQGGILQQEPELPSNPLSFLVEDDL